MYADFTFYTGTFYGTAIAEADFPRLASRASDFLDYYTQDRAKVYDPDNGGLVYIPLQKACCAIAEQMQTVEKQSALAALTVEKATKATIGLVQGAPDHELKSETIGTWSGTYITALDYMSQNAAEAAKAQRAAYALIAAEYLSNTGLLYRGGCF